MEKRDIVPFPVTIQELQTYAGNLSGILHLFAGETQKLVQNYRITIGQIKQIVGGKLIPTPDSIQDSNKLSHQWNIVLALAEELRVLITDEDFGDEPPKWINRVQNTITEIEDVYTTIVVEYLVSPSSDKDSVEKQVGRFEASFPQATLNFLTSIKKQVGKHLQRIKEEMQDPAKVQEEMNRRNQNQLLVDTAPKTTHVETTPTPQSGVFSAVTQASAVPSADSKSPNSPEEVTLLHDSSVQVQVQPEKVDKKPSSPSNQEEPKKHEGGDLRKVEKADYQSKRDETFESPLSPFSTLVGQSETASEHSRRVSDLSPLPQEPISPPVTEPYTAKDRKIKEQPKSETFESPSLKHDVPPVTRLPPKPKLIGRSSQATLPTAGPIQQQQSEPHGSPGVKRTVKPTTTVNSSVGRKVNFFETKITEIASTETPPRPRPSKPGHKAAHPTSMSFDDHDTHHGNTEAGRKPSDAKEQESKSLVDAPPVVTTLAKDSFKELPLDKNQEASQVQTDRKASVASTSESKQEVTFKKDSIISNDVIPQLSEKIQVSEAPAQSVTPHDIVQLTTSSNELSEYLHENETPEEKKQDEPLVAAPAELITSQELQPERSLESTLVKVPVLRPAEQDTGTVSTPSKTPVQPLEEVTLVKAVTHEDRTKTTPQFAEVEYENRITNDQLHQTLVKSQSQKRVEHPTGDTITESVEGSNPSIKRSYEKISKTDSSVMSTSPSSHIPELPLSNPDSGGKSSVMRSYNDFYETPQETQTPKNSTHPASYTSSPPQVHSHTSSSSNPVSTSNSMNGFSVRAPPTSEQNSDLLLNQIAPQRLQDLSALEFARRPSDVNTPKGKYLEPSEHADLVLAAESLNSYIAPVAELPEAPESVVDKLSHMLLTPYGTSIAVESIQDQPESVNESQRVLPSHQNFQDGKSEKLDNPLDHGHPQLHQNPDNFSTQIEYVAEVHPATRPHVFNPYQEPFQKTEISVHSVHSAHSNHSNHSMQSSAANPIVIQAQIVPAQQSFQTQIETAEVINPVHVSTPHHATIPLSERHWAPHGEMSPIVNDVTVSPSVAKKDLPRPAVQSYSSPYSMARPLNHHGPKLSREALRDSGSIRESHGQNKMYIPDDYHAPTEEEDRRFLASLPPQVGPELILQAVNNWRLLPGASERKQYMRIDLSQPARMGRGNPAKHAPNFISMGTSQVVSRQHLDIWETNGTFMIADIGSNSGTWLNGSRLSDAGKKSLNFHINRGDILRLGADYKRADEHGRDQFHQCIVMRILPRPWPPTHSSRDSSRPELFNSDYSNSTTEMIKKDIEGKKQNMQKLTEAQYDKFQERADDVARRASSMETKAMMRNSETPQPPPTNVIATRTIGALRNEVYTTSGSLQNLAYLDPDTANSGPFQVSHYYLSFTATNLPHRTKKIAIHNPSNIVDVADHPYAGDGSYLDMIGPEIVNVSLKHWDKSKGKKLVFHDLRIPTRAALANPPIGTALEIVKDPQNPGQWNIILLTGEVADSYGSQGDGHRVSSIGGQMFAFQLGVIDYPSVLKCRITLCYQYLPFYQTDTQLIAPGPADVVNSAPMTSPRYTYKDVGPPFDHLPIVSNPPYTPRQDTFPSISLIGDFAAVSTIKGVCERLDTSLNPDTSYVDPNNVNLDSFDKSRLLTLIKRPLPSRSQRLIGEIRGKQVVKKSVMETKYVIGLEILEENLWTEMETAPAVTHGLEWMKFENRLPDHIKWTYRKEWWSLVLLGSLTYGFLKE